MLRGNACLLNDQETPILARWIAKTAYMFRFTTGALHPNPAWLHLLYKHGDLPPATFVWVAAFNGAVSIRCISRPLVNSIPSEPDRTFDGELFTIAIQHVVLQIGIFGYSGDKTVGLEGGTEEQLLFFDQIWPHEDNVTWPPARTLDAKGLNGFATRYISEPAPEPLP